MKTNPPAAFPEVPSLDGLRAVAVALVVVYHATFGRLPGGWVGVDLFFALSGYLITGILTAELTRLGTIRFGRFYIRRALRLGPGLVAAVLLAGVLWPVTRYGNPAPKWPGAALASLLYAANLVDSKSMGSLAHFWSLAVEEHFYLIWPPLLFAAWRISGRRSTVLLAFAGMVAVATFRAANGPVWLGFNEYSFTLSRADELLAGAAAAMIFPPTSPGAGQGWAGSASVVGLLALPLVVHWVRLEKHLFGFAEYSIIAIACAGVVVSVSRAGREVAFLRMPSAVWIGRRSYGIYLYHLPVFCAVDVLRIKGSFASSVCITLFKVVITLAIAALSYRFLELPFLRLKERLAPRDDRARHRGKPLSIIEPQASQVLLGEQLDRQQSS
jgi:peptidoglycan/LPS O-acetylase OafA/YrhL